MVFNYSIKFAFIVLKKAQVAKKTSSLFHSIQKFFCEKLGPLNPKTVINWVGLVIIRKFQCLRRWYTSSNCCILRNSCEQTNRSLKPAIGGSFGDPKLLIQPEKHPSTRLNMSKRIATTANQSKQPVHLQESHEKVVSRRSPLCRRHGRQRLRDKSYLAAL